MMSQTLGVKWTIYLNSLGSKMKYCPSVDLYDVKKNHINHNTVHALSWNELMNKANNTVVIQ